MIDPNSHEEFICEQMHPLPGARDVAAMTRGEPGLPERFEWRGVKYRIITVLEKWKTHGPCVSGASEKYLRRHFYKIVTEPRAVMTIYFDRQPKDRKHPKARWWIYSAAIDESAPATRV